MPIDWPWRAATIYIVARVAVNAQHDFHLTLYLANWIDMAKRCISSPKKDVEKRSASWWKKNRGKGHHHHQRSSDSWLREEEEEEVNRPLDYCRKKASIHTVYYTNIFFYLFFQNRSDTWWELLLGPPARLYESTGTILRATCTLFIDPSRWHHNFSKSPYKMWKMFIRSGTVAHVSFSPAALLLARLGWPNSVFRVGSTF